MTLLFYVLFGALVGIIEGIVPGIGAATSLLLLFPILTKLTAYQIIMFFIAMMISS